MAEPAGPGLEAASAWEPPGHLSGEAEAAWRHVVALLGRHGALDRTDPTLIEAYAANVANLRQAQRTIDIDGVLLENSKGSMMANPACAIVNAATMRIKAIINDLGLCPASSKFAGAEGPDSLEGDGWGNVFEMVG